MKFKLAFVLGAAATMVFAPMTASAHDNGYNHRHQNNNSGDRILGTALGAIAGGVLGSNLAAGDVQQEGTALGAVLGGVAGYAIAGSGNNNGYRQSGNYYNTGHNGGYYNGGNNGGYYNTGNNGYYNQGYNQGYSYPSYGHNTNTYYSQPRYYSQPNYNQPYYNSPPGYYRTGSPNYGNSYTRPRLSISIGSGGYYSGGNYGQNYRNRHRSRHQHTRHCRH